MTADLSLVEAGFEDAGLVEEEEEVVALADQDEGDFEEGLDVVSSRGPTDLRPYVTGALFRGMVVGL